MLGNDKAVARFTEPIRKCQHKLSGGFPPIHHSIKRILPLSKNAGFSESYCLRNPLYINSAGLKKICQAILFHFIREIRKMKKSIQLISLIVLLFSANTSFAAAVIFSFQSSEQSWVGQGESVTVTPDDGYVFIPTQSGNSLHFGILGPDWDFLHDPINFWGLTLAAPFGQVLEVGLYDNATHYSFQDAAQPGLIFSGNYRDPDQLSGFFEILEISFNGVGEVDSLAVDFTQYDENNPDWWNKGQLRFNSDVPLSPVPLPASIWLFFTGLAFLFRLKART